jgi:hypothetical protein
VYSSSTDRPSCSDASQVLPQSYPSLQRLKYVRESNPAEQASEDSHIPGPTSMDPPPNIDSDGDDPPPYDDLTSIRPVSQHIIAI